MAVYAAQVDRMDQGIGRILAALRESGVEQNTLVLFLSDNGGCAELLREDGQRAREWPVTREGHAMRFGNIAGLMPGDAATYQSYDLPWANASNTPFRLYKHWVHEGGISTPLIAHWPAAVAGGGIVHAPVHIVDMMATFVDVAGVDYPAEYGDRAIQPLEGESFLPALQGENWRARAAHPVGARGQPRRARRALEAGQQVSRRLGAVRHGRGSHRAERPVWGERAPGAQDGESLSRVGGALWRPALGAASSPAHIEPQTQNLPPGRCALCLGGGPIGALKSRRRLPAALVPGVYWQTLHRGPQSKDRVSLRVLSVKLDASL